MSPRHCTPWVLLIISVMTAYCAVPKALDLKLMKEVTTDLGKNEAISPFVMSTLMTQVWLAANGTTRNEMTQVLGIAKPSETTFLPAYKSAIDYIAKGSSQLTTAVFNRMYVKSTFSVKPSFSSLLATYYNAGAVSFSSPSQAATQINSDVASVTNNRIKDLVSPTLLRNAALVLVSALYFKGEWKYPFNPALPGYFLTQSGGMNVNMMELEKTELLYVRKDTYDVVSLPYTDEDYCMLLIRPVRRNMAAVTALRNSLDTLNIDNIVQDLTMTEIEVSVPRFKVEAEYRMKNAMSQLGIQSIFGISADLSGLSDTSGLYVSAIVHKVFIEVNENGTEAAGTGAVFVDKIATFGFRADRPFFAVVYNKQHRISIFTAFIGSPSPRIN